MQSLGLTHLEIPAADAEHPADCHPRMLVADVVVHGQGMVRIQTPARNDAIVYDEILPHPAASGGVSPIGFRFADPSGIDPAAADIEAAEETLLRRGAFRPGAPSLSARDFDGCEIRHGYE